MNIPVVVATGNNFTGAQGEGFAAIVQGTISVTATDLSGHLLPDAQRLGSSIGGASATVIAAPGDDMQAPYGDNGTAVGRGDELRHPAGQRRDRPAPADLRAAVRHPADRRSDHRRGSSKAPTPIYDPVTGITIGQLDIPKAAALIPAVSATPAPARNLTTYPGQHGDRGADAEFHGHPDRHHDHGAGTRP